jgi:capsular polysaccharide transport system permease protein
MAISHPVSATDPWQGFVRAAKRQSAVVLALIFKDYRMRMGRSRLGLVWMLLTPISQIGLMATMWYILGRPSIDGVHVILYLTVGYIPYLIVRRGISSVPSAIRNNLPMLDYPQVKPFDTLISRYALDLCLLALAVFLMFFGIWWILGLFPELPQPLELLYVLCVAATMGLGIGLILGVYGTLYDGLLRGVDMATRPLVLISGVLHPVNELPPQAQKYIQWNPILQLVEHMRVYGLGTTPFAKADLYLPSIEAVVLLGIGMLAYYINRFRLLQR